MLLGPSSTDKPYPEIAEKKMICGFICIWNLVWVKNSYIEEENIEKNLRMENQEQQEELNNI